MKKVLLILLFTSFHFFAQAQFSRSPINEVLNALKYKHVQDITRYMDNFIEIMLNNGQSLYSKNQAEIILKDFFEKNNTSDFMVVEDGTADKNSKFAIASFTSSGVKYSLYILIKQKDKEYLLQEIRINKE